MFSSLRSGLKSIDFYKAVPSDLSEGTASGACISISAIAAFFFLTAITLLEHFEPSMSNDLIINSAHLEQKLKVNIDISFPNFPCSMLSLDIENILKVHEVNIGGTINKYNLPGNDPFVQITDRNEQKKRIYQDFRALKGCRMKGWFQIDRVPGNFHFSCHGYADVISQIIQEKSLEQAQTLVDFSHEIHELSFGNSSLTDFQVLKNFKSKKEIMEQNLGISYAYFLDIMLISEFDESISTTKDEYMYTVRMNEVILELFPMVYFKYETNPVTLMFFPEKPRLYMLFVKIVGIIGGVFTVATIFDGMIHSSIAFLIQKNRLNKLK